jgi:hypothetical protein
MYTYTTGGEMRRTQIYLDDETYGYLKKESLRSKKTVSDLIRTEIKERMRGHADALLRNIDEIFGIWKDRKIEVDGHIRDMRKDRIL